MKRLIVSQFVVLVLGTVFAWGNFAYEFMNWLENKSCLACALGSVANPFLTPCFFGALFFTTATILAVLILKKNASSSA